MKDKIAQRERTDALVGGYTARTFNEFVKEKAEQHKITPACVRSIPEVKAEWKQIQAKRKEATKADKLAKSAETKAQKKALSDAKKAEKKALSDAKKAEKKTTKEIVKDKTAIKKVAKKSAVDTENIKMTLVEKAHKKSREEKPPQEPKVKGRPKKYATPEEARRAKIEATKVLNKAKKEKQKASLVENKVVKRGQQGQPVYVPIRQRTNRSVIGDRIAEEIERDEMGAEDISDRTKKIRRRRVARQRKETEMMGMEDEDAPAKLDPDVVDAELKIYMAKTSKDLDGVLSALRRAEKKYDRLDPASKRSYNHTLQVYSQKKMQEEAMIRTARDNLAMFKKAKETRPERKREKAEQEAMTAEDINRAKKTAKPRQIRRKTVAEIIKKSAPYRPEFSGRGLPSTREFENYDRITEHLGQHLNDLNEAIDPKDLRDYIHFTKEKARLKSKLVGGLVHMIGGMEGQDLFTGEPASLENQIINQSSLEKLVEMKTRLEEADEYVPQIMDKINARIELLARQLMLAQNAPRQTLRKNLFGRGYDSDSDSDSDMEGGESLGFLGNIGRALKTSWNRPVQSKAEKNALNAVLNYIEPVAIAPLQVLAPPVGQLAEAQRKLMKSKAGV